MRLTDRQIRALRATVSLGSVTAAAEALHLTQPAVSRILRTLEDEVGFAVLERAGRGVRPTRQGQLLFEEAERLYAGLGDLEASVALIRQGRIGRLRIAAMPVFAETVVAPCVGAFLAAHAEVAVDLEVAKTEIIADGVRRQLFDLGVATPAPADPAVAWRTLQATPSVCVMAPGHALAGADRVQPADLAGHDVIALPPDSPQRMMLDAALGRARCAPRVVATARTQAAVCEMIAAGAPAVAVVDAALAGRYAGTLAIRPLGFEAPSVLAVCGPRSGLSPLAQAFADLLSEGL